MGTRAFVMFALCALIMGAWATGASAADINVPGDHQTIQAAIDAANLTGDTIFVGPGLYLEAIVINKELILLGATSSVDKNSFVLPGTLGDYNTAVQSVIKAPAAGDPNAVSIESSNVTLQGFVIEALDRTASGGNDKNNLIELRTTADTMTGITIKNNVIGPNTDAAVTPHTMGRHGVRITASGKTIAALVTGNKIFGTYGNGNNVFIWGTAYGNTGTPPDEGALPAADLSGTVIENNHICYSARSGVELSGAQGGLTIHNNRIYGNGAGQSSDPDLKWGSGIMFVRDFMDVIHGTDPIDPGIGAAAGFVDGVTISDNDIYDNTKNGIYFGPMNKNHTVTGNNIHDNGWDGFRVDLEGWYYSSSYFGGAYANAQYGSTSNIKLGYGAIHGNTLVGASVVGTPTNGFVLDASANWWGSADPTAVASEVLGTVDYSPWLASGTDTSTDPGFQGDFSELWVDDDSDQTGSVGLIGEGIGLVSGSTVNVAAGTYREQVKIDGKSLDLIGAGVGSTIIEAVDVGSRTIYNITQWVGDPRPIDACIGVVGPATVNISDLTVDGRELGPNNFYGIHFFDTSGSVTDCRIEDILYTAGPSQSKVVSLVATHSVEVASYAIDFSGNVIPNFQKGGVLLMGPYLTFTVDDNEITNVPSSSLAGNGIQLSYGATGSTSGNVVDGVAYLGEDWTATGILLFESGDITMDGDVVYNCQTAVDYSNWGWIYPSTTVVDISVADLLLYDNRWSLGAQLSADDADLTFAADDCVILDSTGDGIDLFGTDDYPGYYAGWSNGDLIADITNCVIVGTTLDGIWVDDYSGNITNTMDIEVHDTSFESNVGSGVWNSSSYMIDATDCWWGDPSGPTVLPPARDTRPAKPPVSPFGDELPEQGEVRYAESSSSRAVSGVYGPVAYTPWLPANIVCVPDPESLTATDPVKTIDVNYLGGGSGPMYGYTVKLRWDGTVAHTSCAVDSVWEGALLSSTGTTLFTARRTGDNEITVDCLLLGAAPGVSGSGTMFSVKFTGEALGTSDVGIIVDRVRDKDNNALTGFVADYGLLIVDLTIPTVANVEITNDEPDVSDLYVKNGDQVTVTANVSDDDPAFDETNIEANLSGLGGASDANPDTYADPVATWTLPSVTCPPPDGTVTVTVTATDPIGNTANDNDTIIADNTAPLAVTGFDAAPAHEECVLTWTNGYDLYFEGVVVQRDAVGSEYPQYPWFVTNWPAVGTAYPGSELLGTNAYNGTGTGVTDGTMTGRNIYYYQAFCYDGARNYGPVATTAQDLATNYWLGDISDGFSSGWGYDGLVDDGDILMLSGVYGNLNPVIVPGEAECDVGPTVHPDWHRLGLPLPDDKVEFEDAMIFAMNYGVVAAKVVPFLPEEYSTDVLALTLSEREMVGTEVEVALRLEGNVGDVKGVSAAVAYDASELAFVSARLSDDMSLPLADVFFWSGTEEGRVLVDALVLGTDVTIGGSGDVAVLTFRVVGDGYSLEVESARIRNADNVELDAKLGDIESGGEMPLVFRLVQNAPNPFNPVTKIAYHVPRESEVTIRVYDVAGRAVTTLVDGVVEPGRHQAVWNGLNDQGETVSSGVYFCTMEAPDFHDSRKMTLLK